MSIEWLIGAGIGLLLTGGFVGWKLGEAKGHWNGTMECEVRHVPSDIMLGAVSRALNLTALEDEVASRGEQFTQGALWAFRYLDEKISNYYDKRMTEYFGGDNDNV